MKSPFFYPRYPAGGRTSVGLLILRLVFGAGLILHGWPKVQNATNWVTDHSVHPMFQAIGAYIEFLGGIGIFFGFLTSLASLLVLIQMIYIVFAVHMRAGQPFVAPNGGPSYELAALYGTVALTLLLAGPGIVALDALFFRSPRRMGGERH